MTMTSSPADLVDYFNRPFSTVRAFMGENPKDWQPAHRVRLNAKKHWDMMAALHADPEWELCWYCGRRPRFANRVIIQIHHICSGPYRSDEITALIPLCMEDHANVASIGLPRILWARWRWGSKSLDWVRLTMIHGSHLPDPENPPPGCKFWLPLSDEKAITKRAARQLSPAGRSDHRKPTKEARNG